MRDAFLLEQVNDLGVGYRDLGLEVIEGRRMEEEKGRKQVGERAVHGGGREETLCFLFIDNSRAS